MTSDGLEGVDVPYRRGCIRYHTSVVVAETFLSTAIDELDWRRTKGVEHAEIVIRVSYIVYTALQPTIPVEILGGNETVFGDKATRGVFG